MKYDNQTVMLLEQLNVIEMLLKNLIFASGYFSLTNKTLEHRNSELHEINLKMQEMVRLKDDFLSNMSHELRTPLNGIIGFSEIMIDGKVGPVSTEHKEYLNEILSAAHLLILLINDILDIAKVESGKLEFYPENINLEEVLSEIKNIFKKIITEKNINLKIKINSHLKIKIDINKFKQVLFNLASNAFKFTPVGGFVSITASPEANNHFRIDVKDNGIGIAKSNFYKLFIAFQQIESQIPMHYQGTGLGLALAKRIVEAQNGQILVESVLGKGSTFSIILPCTQAKGYYGKVKPAPQPKAQRDTPQILIIEEKSSQSTYLYNDLSKVGYVVHMASNIDEALAICDVSKFDAIILDFFISDINKCKLLRAFRAKTPYSRAPTLMMTGLVDNAAVYGFKIHDFLLKPVKAKDLVDALSWSGATPHSKKLVLIIDDDKKSFALHKKVLCDFGYNFISQSNFEKALEIVSEKHPDALILNPFMPSKTITGFEFLQKIRHSERDKYTPILITTFKVLTKNEREYVKGMVQRVFLKKEGSGETFLKEIFKQLPIRSAKEIA